MIWEEGRMEEEISGEKNEEWQRDRDMSQMNDQ
jgi:hypothetical protein